jgi:ribonuclease-3
MNPLEQRLGYKFRNPLLLAEALTHPSLGYETQRHHFDNQRLEFLGDAVLQLIYTEFLFDTYPDFPEGELTKLRARLVSREGLRINADALDLGKYLMMGRGEEATGGRTRASSLADAYEALMGALYLDSDYVTVRRIVLTETRERLENLSLEDALANPKGRLQEILQSIAPLSPSYEIVEQFGPEHLKQFVSRIVWEGRELGRGTGSSKKEAETQAARMALEKRLWELSVPNQTSAPNQAASDRSQSADNPVNLL